jgi:uncharacterized protein YbaP (TraB family)
MGRFATGFARVASFCTAAIALLIAPVSRADDGLHVFWEVAGRHNTVYLLGSVHVLNANDRALPSVTEAAYADAEVLVEELDPFATSGGLFSDEVRALQFLPPDQKLSALIGPELGNQVAAAAKTLGLDPAYVDGLQPWYAATLITSMRQIKAGFTSEDGVDYQIALRAQRDQKPIEGLETAAEQLAFFAGMSLPQQRDFLADALADAGDQQELRELMEAWRHGDLATLEAQLKQGMDELPELFDRIVVQRNRNWLPRIEQMLQGPRDDYLIVTGALHMVGPQGMVELLRARGYRVTRK